MCLYTLQDKPFVAEKDIVCYKELVLDESNKFVTPVMKRNIPDAVITGRRLYRARGLFRRARKSQHFPNINIVDRGWVHTYSKTPNFFQSRRYNVWFECVIPKGTKYWKSQDGVEYASRSIRFVKPLDGQISVLYADCIGKEFFKKFA